MPSRGLGAALCCVLTSCDAVWCVGTADSMTNVLRSDALQVRAPLLLRVACHPPAATVPAGGGQHKLQGRTVGLWFPYISGPF